MTSIQTMSVSELLSEAHTISDETRAEFANLTEQQLNWRPGGEQWSVAQCFDHLVTANEAYLPTLESVLSGNKKNTFWESLPRASVRLGKSRD